MEVTCLLTGHRSLLQRSPLQRSIARWSLARRCLLRRPSVQRSLHQRSVAQRCLLPRLSVPWFLLWQPIVQQAFVPRSSVQRRAISIPAVAYDLCTPMILGSRDWNQTGEPEAQERGAIMRQWGGLSTLIVKVIDIIA